MRLPPLDIKNLNFKISTRSSLTSFKNKLETNLDPGQSACGNPFRCKKCALRALQTYITDFCSNVHLFILQKCLKLKNKHKAGQPTLNAGLVGCWLFKSFLFSHSTGTPLEEGSRVGSHTAQRPSWKKVAGLGSHPTAQGLNWKKVAELALHTHTQVQQDSQTPRRVK